jgi:hypothetical protein
MNNIEEQLWNYIDGICTPEEQKALSILIEKDERYQMKYRELSALNKDFMQAELDEPSMAFTYNVMESIRAGHAQQPLKAAVNNKIIWGIALFFGSTILILLIFALANINWSAAQLDTGIKPDFKLPNLATGISKPLIDGFLLVDTILGLYLLDSYLQKKKNTTKHEATV